MLLCMCCEAAAQRQWGWKAWGAGASTEHRGQAGGSSACGSPAARMPQGRHAGAPPGARALQLQLHRRARAAGRRSASRRGGWRACHPCFIAAGTTTSLGATHVLLPPLGPKPPPGSKSNDSSSRVKRMRPSTTVTNSLASCVKLFHSWPGGSMMQPQWKPSEAQARSTSCRCTGTANRRRFTNWLRCCNEAREERAVSSAT